MRQGCAGVSASKPTYFVTLTHTTDAFCYILQCEKLSAEFEDVVHLSAGNLLRLLSVTTFRSVRSCQPNMKMWCTCRPAIF